MTLLSIVTPTLNSATTLPATIASIAPLVQSGAEHIVVDSGSTDSTVSIAKSAGCHVIFHPPGNIYEAINAGLAIAKGRWLTYINSDDLLYSDFVSDVLSSIDDRYKIIYGNIDFIDLSGRYLFSRRTPPSYLLNWSMKYYSCIFQQGTLFRSDLFSQMNGFNSKYFYVADRDFFARCVVSKESFLHYSKRTVGAFRLHPMQLSQYRKNDMSSEGTVSRKALYQPLGYTTSFPGSILSRLLRILINIDLIIARFLMSMR